MAECNNFTCGDLDHCRYCWAAAAQPTIACSLGRVRPNPVLRPAPPGSARSCVCPQEGRVVQRCCASQAAIRNLGHLRHCTHPENPTGQATRGINAGHHWSCADCQHHPIATSVQLWPGWDDPITHPYDPGVAVPDRIRLMHDTLLNIQEPPSPDTAGAGIVICGEGRYWPGIYILIRMVRDQGCSLPIEVWHRPRHGSVHPDWLADLPDVTFRDAEMQAASRRDSRIPLGMPGVGGWEAKLYALIHSRFQQIIHLDADTYPVADVSRLLPYLEHPSGMVGWQGDSDQISWKRLGWNVPPRKVPPLLPGGMIALDKTRAWPVLWLTHWICQHSDYYFPAKLSYRQWALMGDDEAMRIAAWLRHTPPLFLGPVRKIPRIGYTVDLEEQPFLSHRWLAKFTPDNLLYGDVQAMRLFANCLERLTDGAPPERPAASHTDRTAATRVHTGA
ncbi:MAG: alpha-1,3-mannosyltransferase family protein [Bacteroidales bacterium]|nr:alpha-1,3-mannosyltransferase family protein [Bacteroidales bacterium]